MPSYTLKASEQFVQTLSNLEKNSSATSGAILDDALKVYNLLKTIVPVASDGKQKMMVRTADGEEYSIILP